jgi:thiamine monophosphate synthase
MKYFAITPDELSPLELGRYLPVLQHCSVNYLYLRTQSLHAELEQLVALIRQHAIMPIIPRGLHQAPFTSGCGMHTRSNEHFEARLNPSDVLQTAACHSTEAACTLLDKGADYVFISPVYRPFSKLGDQRPLIAINTLRMLTRRYGERIVLLGGMAPKRIEELGTLLDADFSVGGISMFFTTGTTDGNNAPADIRQ